MPLPEEYYWDLAVVICLAVIITGLFLAWKDRVDLGRPESGDHARSRNGSALREDAWRADCHPAARSRAKWDVILALSGLGYIALALCWNLESPLFVVMFVLLAMLEVVEPHQRKHGRTS